MNAAITVGVLIKQILALIERAFELLAPPGLVDDLRFAAMHYADAQRRLRIEQPDGEKTIVAIEDHRQLARLAFAILFTDAAIVNPGMAGADLFLGGRANSQAQLHPKS